MWVSQDEFDHDKGQKSAIPGHHLHWNFSFFLPLFFLLSSGFLCNLVKTSPEVMWRRLPDFRAEDTAWNPVVSLAVFFFFQSRVSAPAPYRKSYHQCSSPSLEDALPCAASCWPLAEQPLARESWLGAPLLAPLWEQSGTDRLRRARDSVWEVEESLYVS